MEFRQIWKIILRRRILIILIFLTLFLTSAIGSFLVTPIYESKAKILIDGRGSASLNGLLSAIGITKSSDPSDPSDKSIATKTSLIISSEILQDLANKLQLRDDYDKLTSPDELVNKRLIPLSPSPYVEVEQDAKSTLLKITASSADPTEAQYMAMVLAEIFIDKSLEWTRAEYDNAASFIDNQIAKIRTDYIAALKAVESYKMREKIVDLKAETTVRLNRIATLQNNLDKLIITYEEKRIDQKDSHPDMVALKNQITKSEQLLNDELIKTFGKEKSRTVKPSNGEQVEEGSAGLPSKELEVSRLEAELKAAADLYYNIIQYKSKIGVAKAMSVADVRLIVPPVKPEQAVFPNKKLNMIAGIFLGLIFGLGFAFFFEYIDNTIKEAKDLKDYGIPIVGQPIFNGRPLISSINTNGPAYESYRAVFNCIHFATADAPAKKLLITSAGPNEGKTTIVATLGILYAREGKRTLLVDANLGKPQLHDLFGTSNDRGFTDLLEAEANYGNYISETAIDGLSLLPGGRHSKDPALMLKSDKMRKAIESLASMYDIILFDSAPLNMQSDVVFLMRHVDSAVMVLRENLTTHQSIASALEILKKAKISPIGIILNNG